MKKIVVEARLCTGCRLCEAVCAAWHEDALCVAAARIRVFRRERAGRAVAVTCTQCQESPCARVCPVAAIRRSPSSGALVLDPAACIGCELCVAACPIGAVFSANGKVVKCDLCGGEPKCVQFCSAGALRHVAPLDVAAERSTALAQAALEGL